MRKTAYLLLPLAVLIATPADNANACDINITDWNYRTFAAGQIVKIEGVVKNTGKTACGRILLNLRAYTKGDKWFGNAEELLSADYITPGGEYGFSANIHKKLGDLKLTEIRYTTKDYGLR